MVLDMRFLCGQNKVEPNQPPVLGCKDFNQPLHSLKHSHVYFVLMKYDLKNGNFLSSSGTNGHQIMCELNVKNLKNGDFSGSSWTYGLHIMCELNVKNCNGGMGCVCFTVYIYMAAEDQVNVTDRLCIRSGAWLTTANFTESYNAQRLTIWCKAAVKLSRPAVKVLNGTFIKQTEDWTIPSLICLFTTLHCQLILSHNHLCMISLMRGSGDCKGTYRSVVYQLIWTVSLKKLKELNRMANSSSILNMHTCTDMWNPKEISLLQWQICTLLCKGLVHQWIMRALLITASLFLISQTAVVTAVSYTQRYVFTQRSRNSNQRFLLLFTMSWCSLSPPTVTRQSTGCSCKLHHTAFGITFVLCLSCVLGKTIVVLMAFKATFPGSDVINKWFGPLPHRLSVFALIQILVFVFCFLFWFHLFYLNLNYYQEKNTVEYDVFYDTGFFPSFDHLRLSFILTVLDLPCTMVCYSVLNIHAIMAGTTRISLRAMQILVYMETNTLI
nr:uncharacterized protein LOC101882771 isoform X2 [Danio rerio]|eukprot:XP_017207586.1 uncharacterized protein LOC101882771 isoform X2 [Danio rerio]